MDAECDAKSCKDCSQELTNKFASNRLLTIFARWSLGSQLKLTKKVQERGGGGWQADEGFGGEGIEGVLFHILLAAEYVQHTLVWEQGQSRSIADEGKKR